MSSSEIEATKTAMKSELEELRLLIDQTKSELEEWSMRVSDADAVEFIDISEKLEAVYDQFEG